jgi:CRISPR-associated endonuclease/helicase Cas3
VENGHSSPDAFDLHFAALTGFAPFCWQKRLFHQHFMTGKPPSALDLPTGLGKTSVMAIWLIARAHGAKLSRRLIYVVDRRAVVDQATAEAEKLRKALEGEAEHFGAWDESTLAQSKQTAAELKKMLGFNKRKLPISTLRGAHVDNREWLDDPAVPAIIVGTVDMIGSRLLFSGYGLSRKMRPYHAGLLGADALVVLDEAHLVPPFAHLLRAIEQDASLRPTDEADRALLPRFVVLPLSATQRDPGAGEDGRAPFRLEKEDWKADRVTKHRLEAKKRLRLEPLAGKDQDKQLADAARALATKDGKLSRVAVFCDRRDKTENGGGPSAQGVKDELEKLAKGDKKTGRDKLEIHPVEMLVGARRVHEREKVEESLRSLGFIGEKKPLDRPAFLIATSAGEVGVDIDADHMVCDLVPWERMVQRLGRVNRRGEGNAKIKVFWSAVKDANSPNEAERRALIAFKSKAIIENLPQVEGAHDASPGTLRQFAESARQDAALKALIDAATTPEPLRPALNRALADAWSMTSLETHTGRPEVAPWLRGWVEDRPQTTVVWRTHLPMRLDDRGRTILPKNEIEDFFEAAPPHESEKLETETYRVVSWLQDRGNALLKRKQGAPEDDATDINNEASVAEGVDAEQPTEQAAPQARKPARDDTVALILSPSADYERHLTLGYLVQERRGKEKDDFEDKLVGKILVMDARFGGLKDGLLDAASDEAPKTADAFEEWNEQARFRVQRRSDLTTPPGEQDGRWRFEDDFVLRRNNEGDPSEWLIVEHFRDGAQKEDARSISKPQELTAHQDWTRSAMLRIAKAVGLLSAAANALAVGASLHDEGKKAPRWQRAFNAPHDAKKFGLCGPLAKTLGPINQAILGGYRHEFGSLPCIEENAELPQDWRELVLHLVAAHHGRARPVIDTRGCEDGPPSLLEERARAVALRFAALQKRWGRHSCARRTSNPRGTMRRDKRPPQGRAPDERSFNSRRSPQSGSGVRLPGLHGGGRRAAWRCGRRIRLE